MIETFKKIVWLIKIRAMVQALFRYSGSDTTINRIENSIFDICVI